MLAVPFVVGLVTLLRGTTWRWLGLGYLAMLAFVVVTGGKPYYLLGFVPVLLAAGVPGCSPGCGGRAGGLRWPWRCSSSTP